MTLYKSLTSGNIHRVVNRRDNRQTVSTYYPKTGKWITCNHLKPCDLAHFPFIGITAK